jgi:signal transduction histidine kinase
MDYKAFPILYVDDDAANLISFRYLLEDRFLILTASNSDEALRILETGRVAVLLADQRMDRGLSGVQLCALAHARFPEVIRMIVTAYTDVVTLTGGINEGQISRYITKPWTEQEMVKTLKMAIDAFHLGSFTKELQARLLTWEQLSTSSFVVGHVLHDLTNPAMAVRDNLGFGVGSLPMIRSALANAPDVVKARFAEVEEALRDASSAAHTMIDRITHFRQGDVSSLPTVAVTRLERVVEAAVAIIRSEAKKRATLELDVGVKPRVAADPTRVSQIVLNLLISAMEAIAPGAPKDNHIKVTTFCNQRWGGVAIEDGGPGAMHASDGDPFARASAALGGSGRGLDLGVVRELVRTARGEITIERTAAGTLFVVGLPLAA